MLPPPPPLLLPPPHCHCHLHRHHSTTTITTTVPRLCCILHNHHYCCHHSETSIIIVTCCHYHYYIPPLLSSSPPPFYHCIATTTSSATTIISPLLPLPFNYLHHRCRYHCHYSTLLPPIILKTKPVIDPVKALGRWVNGQTNGSLIDLYDLVFIKKKLNFIPNLNWPAWPTQCVSSLGRDLTWVSGSLA